jgi:hypothetical protein
MCRLANEAVLMAEKRSRLAAVEYLLKSGCSPLDIERILEVEPVCLSESRSSSVDGHMLLPRSESLVQDRSFVAGAQGGGR